MSVVCRLGGLIWLLCASWGPAKADAVPDTFVACRPVGLVGSTALEIASISPTIIQTALAATLSVHAPPLGEEVDRDESPRRLGSGVLVRHDGLFLTNAHVVGTRTQLTVTLSDGRVKKATVIGLDRLVDLALAKIDPEVDATLAPSSYPVVKLMLNWKPRIGEPVVAIGYPMNFGLSATRGIVSGLSRAYDSVWPVEFLQHDAALNPGNSGGPLIDTQGCLIGLNTATPMETQFDIGVGLAIPAELIGEIVPQLLTTGYFPRGHLGVYVSRMDTPMARAFGIERVVGVIVDDLEGASSAALAGVLAGDVITRIDERIIRQPRDIAQHLLRRRQGESVQIDVVRRGQQLSFRTVLGGSPAHPVPKPAPESPPLSSLAASPTGLGFTLSSRADRVVVQSVVNESRAEAAGLREGDEILSINGALMTQSDPARLLLAQIVEPGPSATIVLRIGRSDMRARHILLRTGNAGSDQAGGKERVADIQSLPFGPF